MKAQKNPLLYIWQSLQNMHSLLSKYYFYSARSNLLSLPRTEDTIVADIELENF